MLEGLEVGILNLSELLIENKIFRIDSEFQLKEYINTLNKVKNISNFTLESQLELLTDGKHGGVTQIEKGVLLLRNTNIKENEIDLSDKRFISIEESEETLRAEFKENDLLLTTIGIIGVCAKVPKLFPRATINQNLVRIVLKNKSLSSFICCFLNSKYGRNQLLRFGVGNVYQMINYSDLKKILIPSFSSLNNSVDELYLSSENKRNQSKQSYTKAENLLLKEIGLLNFTTNKNPVNIKNFKDSFATSGRLDAEYYQLKYEDIENKIKVYSNGYSVLDDFIDDFSTGVPYKSKSYIESGGIPIIRINNINKGSLDISNAKYISLSDLTLSKKDIAEENDILISMSGTIGSSCKIPKGIKAGVNQRVMKITPKNFNFEVLPLLINSLVGELQLNKVGTGGVQTNISSNDIRKILIPNIYEEKQQQIGNLIEQSFSLKKQSEHLLKVAKKAVEIAIEENEENALEYINTETKE